MNRNHVDPIPLAAVHGTIRAAALRAAHAAAMDGLADFEEWLDHSNQLAVDRYEALWRVQAVILGAQAAAAMAGPEEQA